MAVLKLFLFPLSSLPSQSKMRLSLITKISQASSSQALGSSEIKAMIGPSTSRLETELPCPKCFQCREQSPFLFPPRSSNPSELSSNEHSEGWRLCWTIWIWKCYLGRQNLHHISHLSAVRKSGNRWKQHFCELTWRHTSGCFSDQVWLSPCLSFPLVPPAPCWWFCGQFQEKEKSPHLS